MDGSGLRGGREEGEIESLVVEVSSCLAGLVGHRTVRVREGGGVEGLQTIDGWLRAEGREQGLSRLCVQRVIWTPRTLLFDSLDTQKFVRIC